MNHEKLTEYKKSILTRHLEYKEIDSDLADIEHILMDVLFSERNEGIFIEFHVDDIYGMLLYGLDIIHKEQKKIREYKDTYDIHETDADILSNAMLESFLDADLVCDGVPTGPREEYQYILRNTLLCGRSALLEKYEYMCLASLDKVIQYTSYARQDLPNGVSN